jgi:hypothetical protein
MTNTWEASVSEASLIVISHAEQLLLEEIRASGKCLNDDYHAYLTLYAMKCRERRRLSYYTWEIRFGRE